MTAGLIWGSDIAHREDFGGGEIIRGTDCNGTQYEMVFEVSQGESVVFTSKGESVTIAAGWETEDNIAA